MGAYYTHDGEHVTSTGTCQDGLEDRQFVPPGSVLVRGDPGITFSNRPHTAARWSMAAARWVDVRTDETEWAAVRQKRDQLMAASDWVTLRALDQVQPVPQEWAVYRQALRDVTQQPDPFAIVWPAPPA